MSTLKLTKSITTTTKKSITIKLTAEDIISLLASDGALPPDAYDCTEVSFDVPGGGDYSNMRLDIDRDCPVTATYETESSEES